MKSATVVSFVTEERKRIFACLFQSTLRPKKVRHRRRHPSFQRRRDATDLRQFGDYLRHPAKTQSALPRTDSA